MSDAEEYLLQFACEVQKLIVLHHRAYVKLDRAAIPEFTAQLNNVARIADLAVLVINLPAIPREVIQ